MQLIYRKTIDAKLCRIEIPEHGIALRRDRGGVVHATSIAGDGDESSDHDAAHVIPFVDNAAHYAALVAMPGVRDLYLGGRRPLDVVLLNERDEIVVGTTPLYFTARRPLVAELQTEDVRCSICNETTLSCVGIRCTHCSAVSHAGTMADGSERQCFEHRGSCGGCGLRAEDFEWEPEGDDDA